MEHSYGKYLKIAQKKNYIGYELKFFRFIFNLFIKWN